MANICLTIVDALKMPTGVNGLCEFLAKSGVPDQTSCYAAPDLGQRCLSLSHKKGH